jgi:hypothetical protein
LLLKRLRELEGEEGVARGHLAQPPHEGTRERVAEMLLQQAVERSQAERCGSKALEPVADSRLQRERRPVPVRSARQHEGDPPDLEAPGRESEDAVG